MILFEDLMIRIATEAAKSHGYAGTIAGPVLPHIKDKNALSKMFVGPYQMKDMSIRK